jgi:hypothetical protein
VLGVSCLLNVTHKESGENVYAQIASISAMPKGMNCPPASVCKPFSWEIGCGQPFPDYPWLPRRFGKELKDVVVLSAEWKKAQGGQQTAANGASKPQDQTGEPESHPEAYDPIPF